MGERLEQMVIFDWAAYIAKSVSELGLLFAIPNGQMRRGSPMEPGLQKGVPDMCLPVACGGWHGLYIELKYGYNKPSKEQLEWIERLSAQGYLATICWGADQAILTLKCYLGINNGNNY